VPLNITRDGANAGAWIQEALWFYDTSNQAFGINHWLEMGDSAGTSQMYKPDGTPYFDMWERWWFWVDGTDFPNRYVEHAIEQSPNDATRNFTYIIQWDPADVRWELYICEGPCSLKAFIAWIQPTDMSSQHVGSGMEVNTYVLNTNSNSDVFQMTGMQTRENNFQWHAWPGANWQIDAGCGNNPPYPLGYCLNGIWLSGPPPYDNWRSQKAH
jgi:hypothetical protein